MIKQNHAGVKNNYISLAQARTMLYALEPLGVEECGLADAVGRIVAGTIRAQGDCPSVAVSLKDGYACIAEDLARASSAEPALLTIQGTVTAGQRELLPAVTAGNTVRVMTGAAIPSGADVVLSSESCRREDALILVADQVLPGHNILPCGADIAAGDIILRPGLLFHSRHAGILAAAGVSSLKMHRLPRVAVVATGNELQQPGEPLKPGMVAASNMVTLQAELQHLGIRVESLIVPDDLTMLVDALRPLVSEYDMVITSGGVLDGDRDLTLQAMDSLGIEPHFQRIRMTPGKGVCYGKKGATHVFNLPGGPPSNHVAFFLLVLPAIRRLAGFPEPFCNVEQGKLAVPLYGRHGWTQFVYGTRQCPTVSFPGKKNLARRSEREGQRKKQSGEQGALVVCPLRYTSRLQTMADADCLIELAEDVRELAAGSMTTVWRIR